MGRYEEADLRLKEAIDQDPDEPIAMLSLAWFLATCPDERFRDGERAAILARIAYNKGYGSWRSDIVLAAAQAEAGRFADALSHSDPEFIYFLKDSAKPWLAKQRECYARGEAYRLQSNEQPFILPENAMPGR
jgi:hypothetical protein